VRDREGQDARREALGGGARSARSCWAREDVFGRLDGIGLQVLDRMLRLDEERGVEAAEAADEEVHPAVSSSSPAE